MKSGVSRCLYSFCPEIMIEGNNDFTIFDLFSDICKLLKVYGVVTCDESKAAIMEYTSYIVEKRRQYSVAIARLVIFLMSSAFYHVILVCKLGAMLSGFVDLSLYFRKICHLVLLLIWVVVL